MVARFAEHHWEMRDSSLYTRRRIKASIAKCIKGTTKNLRGIEACEMLSSACGQREHQDNSTQSFCSARNILFYNDRLPMIDCCLFGTVKWRQFALLEQLVLESRQFIKINSHSTLTSSSITVMMVAVTRHQRDSIPFSHIAVSWSLLVWCALVGCCLCNVLRYCGCQLCEYWSGLFSSWGGQFLSPDDDNGMDAFGFNCQTFGSLLKENLTRW